MSAIRGIREKLAGGGYLVRRRLMTVCQLAGQNDIPSMTDIALTT
jgi:hypothetical protein